MKGMVAELLEQGLIVELEGNVRGFVPFSHLVRDSMNVPADKYGVDEELDLVLIEVNRESRRVVLSEKAFYQPKTVPTDESTGEGRPHTKKRREKKKLRRRSSEEEEVPYQEEPS